VRGLLSALMIVLLTCVHGPLTAAMPHTSSHAGDDHHSPLHHDDHKAIVIQGVEAGDTSSNQAPVSSGHHQHLVADAVPSGDFGVASAHPSVVKRLPANDRLLVQDNLSTLLEPPIA
jgi:hypothetical protein